MALPSSGSISLGQVNTELGVSATATRSLNDATTRTLFGVGSGQISLSQGYGKANQFAFTISANQTNADLRTLALNAGWNGSSKVVATINSGVYLTSNSTGTPGLIVTGSFPGGLDLINNGYIVGMGGNGGSGGSSGGGGSGGSGGTGLAVSTGVTITNNGTIAGGGGGGGGGGGSRVEDVIGRFFYATGGGGGGGRTGLTNTSGGGGANAGGAGTINGAGGGGGGNTTARYDTDGDQHYGQALGGTGGSGGGWGANGSNGGGGTYVNPYSYKITGYGGGSGGAAGAAVTGNGNITWAATGTRLGAVS